MGRVVTGAGGHQTPLWWQRKGVGKGRGRPRFAQSWAGDEWIQSSGHANGKRDTSELGSRVGNGKVPGSFLPGPHCPLQPLKDSMCPTGLTVQSSMCQGLLPAHCTPKHGIHVVLGNHKEHPAWAVPGTRRGRCPLSPPVPNRNLRTSAQAWDPPRMLWRKKPHSWDRDWWVWKFPPAGGEKPSSG